MEQTDSEPSTGNLKTYTETSEFSVYSLLSLWRMRMGLEYKGARILNDAVKEESGKLHSLVIISTKEGMLVGAIPVPWGSKDVLAKMLDELLENTKDYTLTHLTDRACIFKYLRSLNRS